MERESGPGSKPGSTSREHMERIHISRWGCVKASGDFSPRHGFAVGCGVGATSARGPHPLANARIARSEGQEIAKPRNIDCLLADYPGRVVFLGKRRARDKRIVLELACLSTP